MGITQSKPTEFHDYIQRIPLMRGLVGGARTTANLIDAGLVDELRMIVYAGLAGLFLVSAKRPKCWWHLRAGIGCGSGLQCGGNGKTPRRRRGALIALGVRLRLASNTADSGLGPWYLAKAKALSVGLSNAYLKSLGLPSLVEE